MREQARGDGVDATLALVPIPALRIGTDGLVHYANDPALRFFRIEGTRLPLTVIEATREARMDEVISAPEGPARLIRLVHRPAEVLVHALASPGGGRIVFLQDVSELRRLERVRQEFIANLSHELRTPLTSLLLAAESLTGMPPPAVAARFAQRVVDEAHHLAGILDNLRQLTEIEAGHMQLNVSHFRLDELLREVVQRSRVDRAIEMDLPPDLVIEGDQTKLAQVLTNLLDNAVKFSPPGAPVEIQAQVRGADVVISVRDHGPGISPQHWEKVFERFYKVDPARTRDLPGSGLGLAITKHLVLAQRGRIWTQAADDGGQVFSIAIPRTLTDG